MIMGRLFLISLLSLPLAAQTVFGPPQALGTPSGTDAVALVLGDLDGDGDLDCVTSFAGTNAVVAFENVGGNFVFGSTIVAVNDSPEIALADIDGDGDLDLVATSSSAQQMLWVPNDGSGAFGAPVIFDVGAANIRSIVAIDDDLDGDPDVLALGLTFIARYENQGGVLGTKTFPATGLTNPVQMRAADLDDDGDVDLAVTNFGAGQLLVYLGDGTGGLSAPVVESSTAMARGVEIADLNGDGDLDLVASSQGGDGLAWYENFGGANFGPALTISGATYIALETADLDGDGDLEILAGTPTGSDPEIHVFGNLGAFFIFAGTLVDADRPLVVAGDVDLDGDIDVIAGSAENDAGPVLLVNATPIVPPYPGSGDPLVFETGVNAPVTASPAIKAAASGATLSYRMAASDGTYIGTPAAIFVQLYPATQAPSNPGGFPEAWINPALSATAPILTLFDGNDLAFGVGAIPPSGLQFAVTIPAGLGGLRALLQGFALAPSLATGNPVFSATDAHAIQFLP